MDATQAQHFAILWQVRPGHGGMTRAVLQRSREFVRAGVRGVRVLTRAETFRALDRFDRVVVLSARQRDDIRAKLGATPNVIVVPVSIDLPPRADARRARAVTDGIMLTSLIPRKRVDDAIDAVAGLDVTHRFPQPNPRVREGDLTPHRHGRHIAESLRFRYAALRLLNRPSCSRRPLAMT